MAKTVQDFLDRRAEYFDEPRITASDLLRWQQEEIEKALRCEEPSGNLQHISRSLDIGNRKVACGATLLAHCSRDIVNPWTFEMLWQEGRDDLCLSCMRRQRLD